MTHSKSIRNRGRRRTLLTAGGIAACAATLALFTDVGAASRLPGQDHASGSFALRDLGTLGGDTEATAMNDDGVVVGWSEFRPGGMLGTKSTTFERAFRWAHGRMEMLPTLGGNWGHARSVNVLGEIVGVSAIWNGRARAFIYVDGSIYDLNDRVWDDATPDNPRFVELIEANAINDQSEIVGCCTVPGDAAVHAYMLVPFPGCGIEPREPLYEFVDLGRLEGDCVALDVNDAREVVGLSGPNAFLWQEGVIEPLETLGESVAHAISGAGVAAGFADFGDAGLPGRLPCLWALAGDRYDLQLPEGWIGEAQGINDGVEVVGSAASAIAQAEAARGGDTCFGPQTSAVLWREGALLRLEDHVAYGFAPRFFLERAVDIDEAGRIVGSGRDLDGRWHAFILEPVD